MARYHFVTELSLTASPNLVWERLSDPSDWPSWWKWLKRVEVHDAGAEDHLGGRYTYTFGTALPYTLAFDVMVIAVDRPHALVGQASGELQGSGHWYVTEAPGGGTNVRCEWLVETTKRWMNVLAPICRPVFSWNHHVVMRDFAAGVARVTSSRLLRVRNSTVAPGTPGFFVAAGISPGSGHPGRGARRAR